ncbi:hypothetical protein F9C07_1865491 [Aspergillus flavus]|uniref:Uncharacterized protein n=2 Tax=Aspergillus flavus TaxID=5059 RepID=A0A7U2MXM2_ASPFN|nr:hypothetical protein BDV35DRAFT_259629 [Aspergillus flavus]QRD91744.1 hypothetical protein F9C07_1865491 [Aspergillus flavus]
MSFPSLLVILFWGAGRLASVRFLSILLQHSGYLRYKPIYNYDLCDFVSHQENPVVCICSAGSPLRSCMPFMHLFYVT